MKIAIPTKSRNKSPLATTPTRPSTTATSSNNKKTVTVYLPNAGLERQGIYAPLLPGAIARRQLRREAVDELHATTTDGIYARLSDDGLVRGVVADRHRQLPTVALDSDGENAAGMLQRVDDDLSCQQLCVKQQMPRQVLAQLVERAPRLGRGVSPRMEPQDAEVCSAKLVFRSARAVSVSLGVPGEAAIGNFHDGGFLPRFDTVSPGEADGPLLSQPTAAQSQGPRARPV